MSNFCNYSDVTREIFVNNKVQGIDDFDNKLMKLYYDYYVYNKSMDNSDAAVPQPDNNIILNTTMTIFFILRFPRPEHQPFP